MAPKKFIVPIPGTKKISRLEENLSAGEIIFSQEELNEIKKELEKIELLGERYNETTMKWIDK
nr:hypothetical protein [Spiroplasma taiwanense]